MASPDSSAPSGGQDPEWAAALEGLVAALFTHAHHRLGEKGVRFDAAALIDALTHEAAAVLRDGRGSQPR